MKKRGKRNKRSRRSFSGAALCGLFAVCLPPFALPGAVDEAELVGVWRVDLKRSRFALVDSNWRRLPLPVRDGEAEKFRLTLNADGTFNIAAMPARLLTCVQGEIDDRPNALVSEAGAGRRGLRLQKTRRRPKRRNNRADARNSADFT